MARGRLERLNQVLDELRRDNPGLHACAVVSSDGMPVAARLPEGVDDLKVAAMAAALQGVAEQAVGELDARGLRQLVVEGEGARLIVRGINSDFMLVMVVKSDSMLGYALWQARRAAKRLSRILG